MRCRYPPRRRRSPTCTSPTRKRRAGARSRRFLPPGDDVRLAVAASALNVASSPRTGSPYSVRILVRRTGESVPAACSAPSTGFIVGLAAEGCVATPDAKRGSSLARVLPGPFALAGRPEEIAVAAGCIVALLLVLAGDLVTPVQVALTALGLIPLLAAAWLLSDRLALAVAVVAPGQLVLPAGRGAVSVPTAVSEAPAYIVLGLVVRLYAGSLAELLSRQPAARRVDLTSRAGGEGLPKRGRE